MSKEGVHLDQPEWSNYAGEKAPDKVEQPTDSERLDWLQAQSAGYGKGWMARPSIVGRGYVLRETSFEGAQPTVREAIDQAMANQKQKRNEKYFGEFEGIE